MAGHTVWVSEKAREGYGTKQTGRNQNWSTRTAWPWSRDDAGGEAHVALDPCQVVTVSISVSLLDIKHSSDSDPLGP
jgi:hypothetical protein